MRRKKGEEEAIRAYVNGRFLISISSLERDSSERWIRVRVDKNGARCSVYRWTEEIVVYIGLRNLQGTGV